MIHIPFKLFLISFTLICAVDCTAAGDQAPDLNCIYPVDAFYHNNRNGRILDITKAPFGARGDGVSVNSDLSFIGCTNGPGTFTELVRETRAGETRKLRNTRLPARVGKYKDVYIPLYVGRAAK